LSWRSRDREFDGIRALQVGTLAVAEWRQAPSRRFPYVYDFTEIDFAEIDFTESTVA
jgi:hypothetical protein